MYVAKLMMHKWEEEPISGIERGYNGTFAIFFYGCNLKCVFCQNRKISGISYNEIKELSKIKNIYYDPKVLSERIIEAEKNGACSISFITGAFYVDEIVETIKLSKEKGLNIPIVYNSNGFETVNQIKKLNGLIDIYLPDFKYYDDELGFKYSGHKYYKETATDCIKEMYEQVDKCFYSEDMKKGVIVRHLVLPSHTEDSKKVINHLYNNFRNDICYSIMSQYTPIKNNIDIVKFPELNRRITKREYDKVVDFALKLGIKNALIQDMEVSKESFIPDF